ncbi:hypothetical protein NFI96_032342 [Prochilodus magdalenae]|nr:hypothetical protein NFI96_032342 [Prochilodus magdalenae]
MTDLVDLGLYCPATNHQLHPAFFIRGPGDLVFVPFHMDNNRLVELGPDDLRGGGSRYLCGPGVRLARLTLPQTVSRSFPPDPIFARAQGFSLDDQQLPFAPQLSLRAWVEIRCTATGPLLLDMSERRSFCGVSSHSSRSTRTGSYRESVKGAQQWSDVGEPGKTKDESSCCVLDQLQGLMARRGRPARSELQ